MKLKRETKQNYKVYPVTLLLMALVTTLVGCGDTSFSTLEDSQSSASESSSGDLEKEDYVVEIEPLNQLEAEPDEEARVEAPAAVPSPPEPLNESLALTCESMDETRPLAAKVGQEISLSLKGEVCPMPLAQDPRILFIVDVSASMADRQEGFFSPVIPGADNFVDGTCGRYEAIKAILAKTKSGAATQAGKAGVVLFGSDIHDNSIAFTDLADFEAQITPESICIATNTTNYEQAFIRGKEWLDAEAGMLKVAYFISDGLPTEMNNNNFASQDEINAASIAAGQALTEVDVQGAETKLFQVFLGPPNPDNLVVMEGIAGNKEGTIAEVEKASDLAKVLTDFSIVNLEIADLSILVNESDPVMVTRLEEIEKGANAKWAWDANNVVIPSDADRFQLKLEMTHDNIDPVTTTIDFVMSRY
ncbi:MAG: VWA domain-containing protein [Oligoflexales bacterium]|nr:VWA domain-containing protein [Oligoflexales bacterium]